MSQIVKCKFCGTQHEDTIGDQICVECRNCENCSLETDKSYHCLNCDNNPINSGELNQSVEPDSISINVYWTCPKCQVANEFLTHDPDYEFSKVQCINCDSSFILEEKDIP